MSRQVVTYNFETLVLRRRYEDCRNDSKGLGILYKLSQQSSGGVWRRLTSILKEVLQWVKCSQTALKAQEKLCMEGRVSQCSTLDCVILNNLATATAFSNTTLISQQPSTSVRLPPPAKRSHTLNSHDGCEFWQ